MAEFNDINVLQLGHAPGTAYCGRIFADLGANVDVLQDAGELVCDTDLAQALAAYQHWLNFGKTMLDASVSVDRLLNDVNIVLDGRPADAPALCPPDNVTVIRLSWFGQTGVYADYAGSDLVCRALAGLVKLAGPVEGPPTVIPDFQVEIFAGLSAFTAAAAVCYSRPALGKTIEVSAHEAALAFAEYQCAQVEKLGPSKRLGTNLFRPTFPIGIYPCASGWLGVTVITPAQWKAFCTLLGMEEELENPEFLTAVGRNEDRERLEARFRPKLLQRSAQEWFEIARKLRLPWVIVPEPQNLFDTPAYAERGAFSEYPFQDAVYRAATIPFLPRQPVLDSTEASGPEPVLPDQSQSGADNSLANLQIIDLTMGWAGPLATRQLADLGADVIKVEARQYPDWWRGHDPRPAFAENKEYEKSPWFNIMNRNKKGVTLNLRDEDGLRILKRLIETADVVIENYSPDVLPKLGIHYDELAAKNKGLIMVSMPAFTRDSVWQDVRAYGSTLEHSSGLAFATGVSDQEPAMNHLAYGDANGGLNGACAVMAALLQRQRTGRGQYVQVSQAEAMLPLGAFWQIYYSLKGQLPAKQGNRHPWHAPHACFRCAGDDQWVAITVLTDVQWQALCDVMRFDDLKAYPELATSLGRKQFEDRIESRIQEWTHDKGAEEVVRRLQASGVPAGRVLGPDELQDDPHLLSRGFWQTVQRQYVAPQLQASSPFRENGAPYAVRNPAPTLGEHNRQVLSQVVTDDEYDDLCERGVIGQALATRT